MNKARISVSERETMGSRSKSLLITLMTLLSVTLIIVVIVLGVGGQNTNSNHEGSIEPVYIGTPIVLSLDGIESNDVSVPLKCEKTGIDTDAGYIKVCEAYFDDTLPLCVKDETISDWFIIYAVCGGYEPTGGTAQLKQKDGCHGNLVLTATHLPDYMPPCGDPCAGLACCCCGVEFYEIRFEVEGDDTCICLDANHLPSNPEVDENPCLDCDNFNCWITTDPATTLQKEVKVVMWQDWTGCESPDQSFEVMLAQKSCFHEFPPELIFIASKNGLTAF
jgi:hypothetical protein